MTPFLLQDVFIEWLTSFDVGASAEYQGLQHEDPTMDEPLRRLGTTVYDNLGALFFFGGAQSNPEDPSESPEIVLYCAGYYWEDGWWWWRKCCL